MVITCVDSSVAPMLSVTRSRTVFGPVVENDRLAGSRCRRRTAVVVEVPRDDAIVPSGSAATDLNVMLTFFTPVAGASILASAAGWRPALRGLW